MNESISSMSDTSLVMSLSGRTPKEESEDSTATRIKQWRHESPKSSFLVSQNKDLKQTVAEHFNMIESKLLDKSQLHHFDKGKPPQRYMQSFPVEGRDSVTILGLRTYDKKWNEARKKLEDKIERKPILKFKEDEERYDDLHEDVGWNGILLRHHADLEEKDAEETEFEGIAAVVGNWSHHTNLGFICDH